MGSQDHKQTCLGMLKFQCVERLPMEAFPMKTDKPQGVLCLNLILTQIMLLLLPPILVIQVFRLLPTSLHKNNNPRIIDFEASNQMTGYSNNFLPTRIQIKSRLQTGLYLLILAKIFFNCNSSLKLPSDLHIPSFSNDLLFWSIKSHDWLFQ